MARLQALNSAGKAPQAGQASCLLGTPGPQCQGSQTGNSAPSHLDRNTNVTWMLMKTVWMLGLIRWITMVRYGLGF